MGHSGSKSDALVNFLKLISEKWTKSESRDDSDTFREYLSNIEKHFYLVKSAIPELPDFILAAFVVASIPDDYKDLKNAYHLKSMSDLTFHEVKKSVLTLLDKDRASRSLNRNGAQDVANFARHSNSKSNKVFKSGKQNGNKFTGSYSHANRRGKFEDYENNNEDDEENGTAAKFKYTKSGKPICNKCGVVGHIGKFCPSKTNNRTATGEKSMAAIDFGSPPYVTITEEYDGIDISA